MQASRLTRAAICPELIVRIVFYDVELLAATDIKSHVGHDNGRIYMQTHEDRIKKGLNLQFAMAINDNDL